MKRDSDEVFIITILYNSEKCIYRFLQYMLSQNLANWRLIVIDNSSPDKSADVVRSFSDSRITLLCNNINVGFARAANQGLLYAHNRGGKFFILMNNDIEFQRDFLQYFIKAQKNLAAEVITPKILSLNDPRLWYAGGYISNEWIFEGKGILESAAWRERHLSRRET